MTTRDHFAPAFLVRLLLRAAVLVAVGAALGLGANLVSPRAIAWVGDWEHYIEALAYREGITLASPAQTRQLLEEGRHLVFDARAMADYDAGHLPGALPFPFEGFDESLDQYAGLLTPSQPVLGYCSGLECDDALLLLVKLRELGFTNVVLFAGGWEAWRRGAAP